MTVEIITGDCREVLRTLPDGSVHCVVTSPPYFGLRDYGHADQLGLEETPDAYVAAMVEVFRECRRVLRDDGTLWLNIGDSYAGSWGAQGRQGETGQMADRSVAKVREKSKISAAQIAAHPRKASHTGSIKQDGLKPKDLIGIPWMLATALRAPYYAGRIRDERDRIWLAAMIDGEGCFYVHKRGAGLHAGDGYYRQTDTFSPAVEVANTSLAIIERCKAVAGVGTIMRQEKDRRQPLYRWTARSDEARSIAREVYPYLVAKQQQARIICRMPSGGALADGAWQGMKLLHAGSATTADFPVPASLHEPGWYLRQDIVWAKPNPMPESVRDRCTKAHEYVFLLSKAPRYLFDAEAIAEPAVYADSGRKGATKEDLSEHRKRSGADGVAASFRAITETRNKRSVWTIHTQPFAEAHFATMAPELARLCIMAGCPLGGTVLDPFGGAGTTGLVADRLQRNAILIELNASYAEMARRRINEDAPLLGDAA